MFQELKQNAFTLNEYEKLKIEHENLNFTLRKFEENNRDLSTEMNWLKEDKEKTITLSDEVKCRLMETER